MTWFAAAQSDVKTADTVLSVDAPLKVDACKAQLFRGDLDACGQKVYDAYCGQNGSGVPTDVSQAGFAVMRMTAALLTCHPATVVVP